MKSRDCFLLCRIVFYVIRNKKEEKGWSTFDKKGNDFKKKQIICEC